MLQTVFRPSSMRLSGIRDSRKAGSPWGMMRGVAGVSKSIHKSWLAKGLGLRLLCWGFKGVQEEIRTVEASTLQIGWVAFPPGQYTSPQLHPCHRLFDQDRLPDSSSPSLSSRPFGFSLSSETVIMWQLSRWKWQWRRSLTLSHKRTSMGHSGSCWNSTRSALQSEKIISKGTRASCVYYQ